MNETEHDIPDYSDVYSRPAEEAVAVLVEVFGVPEDQAWLLVRLAKGEVTGHLEMAPEEEGIGDGDWTGDAGPPPRWMVTADTR